MRAGLILSCPMKWLYALLLCGLASPAFAVPSALEGLEAQLATTTRQLSEIQSRLGNQKAHVQAAQTQAERATIATLRASHYPKQFWAYQSLLGQAPAPGIMAAMAKQQGAQTQRLAHAYGSLFTLYGKAQAKQNQLLALRSAIARTENRTSRRQRAQLARAGIDASTLATQLAAALGEAAPAPFVLPPEPKEPLKLAQKPKPKPDKSKTPDLIDAKPTGELREATALPDLEMADEGSQTSATPKQQPETVVASAPRGRPLAGPVLVKFKQGEGAEAEGVVLGGKAGEAVASPINGKVLFAGEFRQFGGLVIVQSPRGHDEVLGGLGSLAVKANRSIAQGKAVGTLGARERLYWEVRVGNVARNPLTFKR